MPRFERAINDAFVVLNTLAVAFLHLHADADGVARAEFGDVLAGLGDFFGFNLLDQVHWSGSFRFTPRARGRLDPSALMALPQVRPA